jgi:hemin uptake protein HemP
MIFAEKEAYSLKYFRSGSCDIVATPEKPPHHDSRDEVSAEDAPRKVTGHTRCLSSEDLLQGEKEVFILHDSECYRLRVTRQGKLILFK